MSKEKKEDKKVKAPQKKKEQQPIKKAVISPMVHVDEFLDIATSMYGLSSVQQAGFKAFMTGKFYLSDMEAFVPYLDKYLDK